MSHVQKALLIGARGPARGARGVLRLDEARARPARRPRAAGLAVARRGGAARKRGRPGDLRRPRRGRLAAARPLHRRQGRCPTSRASCAEGAGGALETIHPPLSPHRLDHDADRRLAAASTGSSTSRASPRQSGAEGADHQRRAARARALEHGELRRPERARPSACGPRIPAEPVNGRPGFRPADRLPLHGGAAAARHRLPRRARGVGARGAARRPSSAVGYAAAARVPALARRARVPELEAPAAGRPVRAPGEPRCAGSWSRREVYHRLATDWIATRAARPRDRLLPGHRQRSATSSPRSRRRASRGVSEQDYARYHGVPERYFRHVDELLGDYRAARRGGAAPC